MSQSLELSLSDSHGLIEVIDLELDQLEALRAAAATMPTLAGIYQRLSEAIADWRSTIAGV